MPKLSSFPVATDPLGLGDYLIGTHTVLGVTTDVKYSIDSLPSTSLDSVLATGNTAANTITLTDGFTTESLNLTSGVIRMYGTPGNKNAVIQPFNMYVCSDGLNYGIQMTTSNDGSMNFLQFTQDSTLGQIQSTFLSGLPKVWQLPNQSGTFAMVSDITSPTLQQVTTAGNITSAGIYCQLTSGSTCSAQMFGNLGGSYVLCADAAGTAKIQMGIATFGGANGIQWTVPSYTGFLGMDTVGASQSWLLPNRTGTIALSKRGSTPTVGSVGSAAGTDATITFGAGSDDISGTIVINTGTGTASGQIGVIQMANSFLTNAYLITSNMVGASPSGSVILAGGEIQSINAWVIKVVTAPVASTTYVMGYNVVG